MAAEVGIHGWFKVDFVSQLGTGVFSLAPAFLHRDIGVVAVVATLGHRLGALEFVRRGDVRVQRVGI